MKIKNAIFVAIFALLAAVSLSQSNIVSAGGPPATSPVTYYTYHLTGRIVYRLLDHIFPATNARVVAKNVNTNEKYFAQPNIYGYYDLEVTQSSPSASSQPLGGISTSIYLIRAFDNLGTTWQPDQYKIILPSDTQTRGLNFVGTLATSSAQISF